MQTGTKISAVGHGVAIALAVFGLPWFGPRERETIRVTDVSFVTEAEFEAAQAAASPDAPREETAPAEPPPARPAPAPEPAPEPEAAPDVAQSAPETPDQEVATLVSPAPDTPEPTRITPKVITLDPPTAAAPPARPAQRVEPDPTPPPEEDLRPAETPEPVTAPEPEAEVARVEETPAAPPQAAPAPAAEAIPEAPLALATSGRPKPRQVAPKPAPERSQAEAVLAAVQQEAARKPAAAPVPEPATSPAESRTTSAAATSLPVGPPLSSSEKEGLKLAVQRCWNVPAGLRDAQELKVTLAAELAPDGQVINASIRMIEPDPAPDARFKSAFDAGRRALIRCSPYTDLPRDKYAQWRNIEVVFNPEGMVSW
jgi:hypothetical protein